MSYLTIHPLRAFDSLSRSAMMPKIQTQFRNNFHTQSLFPKIDVIEHDNGVVFQVELPGVKKEDVKISISEDGILSIKGTRKRNEIYDNAIHIKNELTFGEFTRSFNLSDRIDRESIKAKFEDGVLTINLNKKAEVKPTELEITIE